MCQPNRGVCAWACVCMCMRACVYDSLFMCVCVCVRVRVCKAEISRRSGVELAVRQKRLAMLGWSSRLLASSVASPGCCPLLQCRDVRRVGGHAWDAFRHGHSTIECPVGSSTQSARHWPVSVSSWIIVLLPLHWLGSWPSKLLFCERWIRRVLFYWEVCYDRFFFFLTFVLMT